jgi:hypothetical protein
MTHLLTANERLLPDIQCSSVSVGKDNALYLRRYVRIVRRHPVRISVSTPADLPQIFVLSFNAAR